VPSFILKKRFDQYRDLPAAERRLIVGMAILLPAIGAGLRLLGYRRTRALIDRMSDPQIRRDHSMPVRPSVEAANRLGQLVRIAANHGPYRATCLRQSLALLFLLRRRGWPAELRIGVRREGDGLDAHAWVELEGFALNDIAEAAGRFAPLDGSYSPQPASRP
jgi:hypothetical protein